MSSPLNFSISSKMKKEGRQASFQRIDISDEGLQINQETKVAHWDRFKTTALFLILMFERFSCSGCEGGFLPNFQNKQRRQTSFQRIDISDEGLQRNQETKVAHWKNRFRTTALFLILMFERFTVPVAREVSCPIFKINKEGRHHSSQLIFQEDSTRFSFSCLKVLVQRKTEVNAKRSKGEVR
jgi:hypothetical protein